MLKKKVQQLAKKYLNQHISIRRHLHQYPELSFKEHQTCQFVKEKLEAWGIETQIMATTGVIGIIKGKNPSSKTLALRADMDALPIQEINAVNYKSQHDGIMHACGHDVHTTCLLGAAQILQELKEEWEGTIKLIFQPGEEQLPGGASVLIKEGVLHNPSPTAILGQHVEPLLEVGKIGVKAGLFMASADEIHVTIRGKGGHGARPHQCVDTILMAAQLIVQLQQLVSRNADPLMPTVLTFGKIFSEGGATNIIPDEVKILGTLRTFDETWRAAAHERLRKSAQLICESMGGTCNFEILKGYPFLKNNEHLTQLTRQQMEAYLGAENVIDLPARMGGEDFAFYSQQIPACFYRLGVQNPNGTGLHTPNFDIDERSLEVGVGLMAWLATQHKT
ncbi:M20 family metallopeptidase [Aureispira sp. CCB-QB1]|uniref:M20 metallopeptidase family protein n=1 Tax=Aureispira sp. CCB-QB1 TaxID=1313421 RepID=UPI000696DEE0|nr:M20 family metallopeptidase [Aureispira sp. CCB-QB1]